MDEALLDAPQGGSRGKQLTLPDSHVLAAQTQSYPLYYGAISPARFTVIALGCGLLVLIIVHESRAWRQLVWDVLHATGITEHRTLRDVVIDIMKVVQEAGRR